MTFGEWFRQQREKRGWSQAWVARRVGVTRSQMNNIEAGRSRASGETLQALCALYEATPAQIVADTERAKEPPTPAPKVHPGIDELAADAATLTRYGITPGEMDLLRSCIYPVTITTKRTALDLLLALRSAIEELGGQ